MVCPVCILPLAGALGAAGSGKAASETQSKALQYVLIALMVGLTLFSLYVFFNRKRLKKDCAQCQIPQE